MTDTQNGELPKVRTIRITPNREGGLDIGGAEDERSQAYLEGLFAAVGRRMNA